MDKGIELKKSYFNDVDFDTVVDTQITTFITPQPVEDTDTIDELFRLYDKLYFSIQAEGATKSHQYLVEKSSEIYALSIEERIAPLLAEITNLRQNLLEANKTILELSK